ncbi:MAG: hypothetical protein AABX91_00970 [Nanoarchaeota archaeon]
MTNLKDLVKRIHKEAGMEVYAHGLGRFDLNDYMPQDDNYRRAVHNLRNPEPGFMSLFPGVEASIGGNIGKREGCGLLIYGVLPGEEKILIPRFILETRSKKGLVGFFGATEEVKIPITPEEKVVYRGTQPLSKLVKNDNQSEAFFALMTIGTDIEDSIGRGTPSYPQLTMLSSRELISDLISYIEKNPGDYNRFLDTVLTQDRFPKVNRGIVSLARQNHSVMTLNLGNYKNGSPKLVSPYGKLNEEVLRNCGHEVKVGL